MTLVFPLLRDVKVEFAWAATWISPATGHRTSGASTRMCTICRVFQATALALTGMAGKLVSEAIAGDAGRFDVFARIPHGGFPGGPALRRPALVLAMMYYRIKDLL